MDTLFVLGSVGFFALLAIELVILILCITFDNAGLATVSLLGVAAALHFFGDLNIFAMIVANPWKVVSFCGLYLVLGVIWSGIRFYFYYKQKVENLVRGKEKWFIQHKYDIKNLDDKARKEWNTYIDEYSPSPYDYKAKILGWMAYWPVSVIVFFLSDILKEVFSQIYTWLTSVYDRIAERIRNKAKM